MECGEKGKECFSAQKRHSLSREEDLADFAKTVRSKWLLLILQLHWPNICTLCSRETRRESTLSEGRQAWCVSGSGAPGVGTCLAMREGQPAVAGPWDHRVMTRTWRPQLSGRSILMSMENVISLRHLLPFTVVCFILLSPVGALSQNSECLLIFSLK